MTSELAPVVAARLLESCERRKARNFSRRLASAFSVDDEAQALLAIALVEMSARPTLARSIERVMQAASLGRTNITVGVFQIRNGPRNFEAQAASAALLLGNNLGDRWFERSPNQIARCYHGAAPQRSARWAEAYALVRHKLRSLRVGE